MIFITNIEAIATNFGVARFFIILCYILFLCLKQVHTKWV